MAHPGRPATKLQITDAERAELHARLRVRKAPEDEKLRMRIVLGCADGESGTMIAQRLGTTVQTVSKWRRRYRAYRLAGLTDAPRAGRPRSVGDEQVQLIVDKVRQSKPDNATHWSVRQMSRHAGVSPATVQRIWHAFGLKPHLQETFKLSTDPHFVDKVRDVVGLYMAPPDRALVLCVDEKSQIQALDRTQPGLAAHPRYHVHFTPTSASWLNLVERFFSQISEQWIKRSAHTSVAQLEQSIREYIDRHNEDPKPFVWHKSADTILASVARAASTII